MYPLCHGSVHTPLPRPATIPEKGVELGWVIGGQITGGQDKINMPTDECICSARCITVGETEHKVCPGPEVGKSRAKSDNSFGFGHVSLGLATNDECICSASCKGNNCRKLMFKRDQEQGIKYCPDLDIDLPVYHHIEYKPRYSAKQNNIFKLDTDTDTMKTQYIVHVEPDHTGVEVKACTSLEEGMDVELELDRMEVIMVNMMFDVEVWEEEGEEREEPRILARQEGD